MGEVSIGYTRAGHKTPIRRDINAKARGDSPCRLITWANDPEKCDKTRVEGVHKILLPRNSINPKFSCRCLPGSSYLSK